MITSAKDGDEIIRQFDNSGHERELRMKEQGLRIKNYDYFCKDGDEIIRQFDNSG